MGNLDLGKKHAQEKIGELQRYLLERDIGYALILKESQKTPTNFIYFVGPVSIGADASALIIPSEGGAVYLTTDYVAETARKRGWYDNVIPVPQDFEVVLDRIEKIVGKNRKIGIDWKSITYDAGREIEHRFGRENIAGISGLIGEKRAIKDEYEIREIEKALEPVYKAMGMVRKKVQEKGIIDSELYKLIKLELLESNVETSFDPTIFFGDRTYATDWTRFVGKELTDKDKLVTVDMGARVRSGYCSDFTRTIPIKSTPEVERIFHAAIEVHNYALTHIKAGKTGKALGEEINNKIREFGYEVLHRPGHQIGLEDHDEDACNAPTFGSTDRDDQPLKEGMVMTVEPGIYNSPNKLGVRFEDIVLITETGVKNLTEYPYEL
jgi:Xaa-Pro aminopeptidase